MLTLVLAVSGCILLFLGIWGVSVTMPTKLLARNFPETEGWSECLLRIYPRKYQTGGSPVRTSGLERKKEDSSTGFYGSLREIGGRRADPLLRR